MNNIIIFIRKYIAIMLYGFSKQGDEVDFFVSQIMFSPLGLVFIAMPLWLILDIL